MSEITIKTGSSQLSEHIVGNYIEECTIIAEKMGDLIFMLLYLTARIKDAIREDVEPEDLLRLIKYVINNNLVFTKDDIREHLENCLRKESSNDNR